MFLPAVFFDAVRQSRLIGSMVPISLLAYMTETRMVSSRRSRANAPRSRRPLWSTGATLTSKPFAFKLHGGFEHRFVLYGRNDDMVAVRFVRACGAEQCNVVRFGPRTGKDNLLRLARRVRAPRCFSLRQ